MGIIKSHNKNWKKDFIILKKQLEKKLKYRKPLIKHIGSTSIEKIPAKPIIDVLIEVDPLFFDEINLILNNSRIIYFPEYEKNIPERKFFIITKNKRKIPSRSKKIIPHNKRIAHLHITKNNSEFANKHIQFKKILKTNEEKRKEYTRLKLEILSKGIKKIEDYQNLKSKWFNK